jgi:hypothetical protein
VYIKNKAARVAVTGGFNKVLKLKGSSFLLKIKKVPIDQIRMLNPRRKRKT